MSAASVQAAARKLDRLKPCWYERINLETLNLFDHCILMQLCGSYKTGLARKFSVTEFAESFCENGSDGNLKAWREEILLRRQLDAQIRTILTTTKREYALVS